MLWLAGARGIAPPAALGCQVCSGCGRAPAVASPRHLPALLLVLPISGHSASHQTPGARCLSFGGVIASPAQSANAWGRAGPSGAEEGLPRETSPSQSRRLFASQPSSAAGSTAWSFARLCLGAAVHGKDERKELWPVCGTQGSLSSSWPQSASPHGTRTAAGCDMGTSPSKEALGWWGWRVQRQLQEIVSNIAETGS